MSSGTSPASNSADRHRHEGTAREVLRVFGRLGLTSFGGPAAHLAYFRTEFVERRGWLSEQAYAELVALCQFLPGPASSQVGMGLGLMRAGWPGALAAWVAFTLPSALLMLACAIGITAWSGNGFETMLHGLKLVTVAVIAQAVWTMFRTLCPDWPRQLLMLLSAMAMLLFPQASTQLWIIGLAALTGGLWMPAHGPAENDPLHPPASHKAGVLLLTLFIALFLGLPVAAQWTGDAALTLFDRFFRIGSLVFGGGHVVLPLMQGEVVTPGWISIDRFLAGYGIAQAVPGPLFSVSAYLGAAMSWPGTGTGSAAAGLAGGVLALVAVFLPSLLLVAGVLPFWHTLRRRTRIRSILAGVNAAVVGLLLAVLYQPAWTTAVHSMQDFLLILLALAALVVLRLPAWTLVLASLATTLAASVW